MKDGIKKRFGDAERFGAHLRANYGYASPAGPAKPGTGRFRSDIGFYWPFYSTCLAASWTARRGRFDQKAYARSSFLITSGIEECGGRIEVSGLEALARAGGPVTIISNHMSTLETCVLACLLLPFRNIAFVIKQSLLDYPFFGQIMRSVGHLAVTRQNPREDLKAVLRGGGDLLRQGVSVIIFPQATRSVVFDVEAFNTLGVKLAARAEVPIVPLALKTDFLGNGRILKDFGPVDVRKTVHFKFGPLIQVKGTGREEHDEVVRFISENLTAWGGTVRPRGEPT